MSKEFNRVQLLRKRTGLSQSKFCEHFNIPVRTLQRWEINQTTPPRYVLDMIERILDFEDILSDRSQEVTHS